MFEALMKDHGETEAWSHEEFDAMFEKFEDDEGEEGEDVDQDGMDRGEIGKMIRYICGL